MNRRNPWTAPGTRRAMLRDTALGFGQLALATLMAGRAMSAPPSPLAGHPPHFAPRARRIIFLFMHGGPSHVDTFDHKPLLERDTGKPLPFAKPRVQFAKTGNLRRSPWEFRRRGQSGATVSELFPLVGGCADDLCFLKAVHGTNEAHGGALLIGDRRPEARHVVRPVRGEKVGQPDHVTARCNTSSAARVRASLSGVRCV